MTTYPNCPILTCECGHRRPGGVPFHEAWFEHEQSHVTPDWPEIGVFTTLTSMRSPAILPPLTEKIRYLA